jgi:hypothetical protein
MATDEFEAILPSAPSARAPEQAPTQADKFEAALERILPTAPLQIEAAAASLSSEDEDDFDAVLGGGPGADASTDLEAAEAAPAHGDIDGAPWPGTPFRVRQERVRTAADDGPGVTTVGTGVEGTLILHWLRSVAPWWRKAVEEFVESVGPSADEGYRHTVIILGFPLGLLTGSAVVVAMAGSNASATGGLTAAVAQGAWLLVAVVAVCAVTCLVCERREVWDPFWTVYVTWFAYSAALLVLPVAFIMSGTGAYTAQHSTAQHSTE